MNIELRHLRYFVAVAEDGSFSAAARRIHVAQQVLSTQIRRLETAVGTDLVRPPVDAPGITLEEVEVEPRVFVLPAGHPLASRDVLELADVAGLPWVSTALATDGCAPARWRDDWLVNPRPGGDVPVIGAVARTIDEWREYVVAGRGISLCPASSEVYHARPGLAFVPSKGVPLTSLAVAWRADDARPTVRAFVELATRVARDGAPGAASRAPGAEG
jgi:DNA-binding transcriptional LysR family regulator